MKRQHDKVTDGGSHLNQVKLDLKHEKGETGCQRTFYSEGIKQA